MTAWSRWQVLEPPVHVTAAVLAEILDGGQAFRWNLTEEGCWQGVWSHHVARLGVNPEGKLQWSAPAGRETDTLPALRAYLGNDREWNEHRDALPWRSDPVLAHAIEAWPGLRLLRQPFGETLLMFLASSAKRIPHIKACGEAMAANFGPELVPGIHALPSWETLRGVSEEALRGCGLGYRARSIHAIARQLASQPGWLNVVEALPYAEAKARLIELPGVGPKIADCALLFGAGRDEAFPVDTWIARTVAQQYGLTGWKPDAIALFGRAHFGASAGLAQQYLFAQARRA